MSDNQGTIGFGANAVPIGSHSAAIFA